jgi:predicted ester cyclase
MAEDPKKTVYRRFVEEVINGGDIDVVEELFSPDYVDHSAPPGAPGGLEGVKMIPRMFRGAFPDLHFTIDEMVSEGDVVATRVTGHGTQNGQFMALPPSGREATWASMGFFRVADGKIVEHWGVPDLLGILTQLGAVPPPGGGQPGE